MATRNTRQEADELTKKWQAQYPQSEFVIIDRSGVRNVGRAVAERDGYEIIEDTGGPMVKAMCTEFDVLEVKHCHCGAEVLTAAVGENGTYECKECREKTEAERKRRSVEDIEKSRQAVAQHKAFDDFWG